ncbi:angiopoietin-2 [Vespula squamosa]|uniref:Angiopoietin-2 n=1 Tax=Vespula squamosa TaxID=30214 RepID=A0ABD2AII5_VESSQ
MEGVECFDINHLRECNTCIGIYWRSGNLTRKGADLLGFKNFKHGNEVEGFVSMREAAIIAVCLLGFVTAGSPRLPRTSADQRNTRNASVNVNNVTGNSLPPPSRGSQRNRKT